MSRAKRIVRFTFWMNNLIFLSLICLYAGLNHQLPGWIVSPSVIVGIIVLVYMYWYLANKLDVNIHKMSGFYFVDDERDKEIALKVHSHVLTLLLYGIFILIPFTYFLTLSNLSISAFSTLMILALIGLILISNIQYYYLWSKYDPS